MIKKFLEGVTALKNLRRKFERFCVRNRDKGIPNLMLYIAIGNLIVFLFSIIDPTKSVHRFLYFDPTLILHGQVWRLVTYIFTYVTGSNPLGLMLSLISLYCYYWIGKNLEAHWGVFRFNLFYFSGVLIMDIAALMMGTYASTYYLNLSLFLAYATIAPDTRFLLFYFIPVKAKYLAWFDIFLTLWAVVTNLFAALHDPSLLRILVSLYPLIALLNYILFFGSDIRNILPDSLRYRTTKTQREYRAKQRPDPNWSAGYRSSTGEKPYRHKCTVCGRTDVTNPELEFRYCSKCTGYHCYCEEHIFNHVHFTE